MPGFTCPIDFPPRDCTPPPSAPADRTGLPIEAELPNGIRLRIPTVNEHLACRLLRAVAAAKTNSGGTR